MLNLRGPRLLGALLKVKDDSPDMTVRARPERLSALSVSHSKSILYGASVWVRKAPSRLKWAAACPAGQYESFRRSTFELVDAWAMMSVDEGSSQPWAVLPSRNPQYTLCGQTLLKHNQGRLNPRG